MAMSKLDANQCIKTAFNDATGNLKVETTATVIDGQQEVLISQTDDSIVAYGNDGATNRALKTDAAGELQVDVVSSALPTGAATETTVVSINTKTPALGQAVSASSVPVVIASNQSILPVVLSGTEYNGSSKVLTSTAEGHLEVAIHDPTMPFTSVHTESLYPIFQVDGVYGVNSGQNVTTVTGTGSTDSYQSSLRVQTGTTALSQAIIQSRKRLRYRPGQGVVGRFSAKYTSPVASSYQIAGFGHTEDGVYFGYKNTDFGILYSAYGVREIQTLTITTGSTTAENAVVTLAGTAFNIAVTNSGSTVLTAYELSQGTYAGWSANQVGSTVIFLADAVGDKTGTFSVAGTSLVGSFVETLAGVAATEVFVTQANWNGDPLNGTGASALTIDPTMFNSYQIGIQYLGSGIVEFKVELTPVGGNNSTFILAHTLDLTNNLTRPFFGNPSFPFTMAAYSAGSVTNLTIQVGSYAGFIEGSRILQGNRFSYYAQSTAVTAAAFVPLITLENRLVYQSKANQAIINLLSVTSALKHNNPCSIYLFKNATLTGIPNFTQYSANSCSLYDTAATGCSITTNDQLVWVGSIGETGNLEFSFEDDITLQPGETLTIAAKTVFGSAAYVVSAVNTREDQ